MITNLPYPSSGQIIVIDDEPLILKLTIAILEREGYNVLTAHTPELAINLISQQGASTSAFIVDCGLNDKSNLNENILTCIRTMAPSSPVLFISGSTLCEKETSLLNSKHTAFVLKPFKITEITETLKTLIANSTLSPSDLRFHHEKTLEVV